MEPLLAAPTLLSASNRMNERFTPHPDHDREMVAWSPENHRPLGEAASGIRHAIGTLLVGVGSRLQRPVTAAAGSEATQ